ncbi:hypothetical protein K438DRAFT_1975333 [Mycena galopus ATCC 62051]|nr:hypothetical protein K438DRAFT_1975333 [Mycena galopus ATCC 62051]
MSDSTNNTAHLTLSANELERQCQELKSLNSALARDYGELHAHFMKLASDFKELAAEYNDLYTEYDTLVEDHEALATKHEALATQHQRLRCLHARTVPRRPRQTPINPGPQMATSPAVQPVLTMLVADVPQERRRSTT